MCPVSHYAGLREGSFSKKKVESRATHVQEGGDDEGLNESFTFELDEDVGNNSYVFPMAFTQSTCQLEGILSQSHLL
jgi:hypothetical protein